MKKLVRTIKKFAVLIGVVTAFVANPAAVAQVQAMAGVQLPSFDTVRESGAAAFDLPGKNGNPCLNGKTKHFEVCFAYTVNASYEQRASYYKLANDPDSKLSSRYTGQALRTVRSHTTAWPANTAAVATPKISIVGVHVSKDEKYATLTTRETWRVTGENGKVLYKESGQPHKISMERTKGVVLQKWVVTDIR